MKRTNVCEMTEETELGLERLKAASGGVKKLSDATRQDSSDNIDIITDELKDIGKDIEYMKKNPSYFFLVMKNLF